MSTTECGKSFNGENMNARIASIFVLLVVSAAGSFSPILAIKYQSLGVPSWVIFVARYFGSGVILATAFIHLLGESNSSFASPCLGDAYKEYLWGSALALMGSFTMFTIEVATQRLIDVKAKKSALKASNSLSSITDYQGSISSKSLVLKCNSFEKKLSIPDLEIGGARQEAQLDGYNNSMENNIENNNTKGAQEHGGSGDLSHISEHADNPSEIQKNSLADSESHAPSLISVSTQESPIDEQSAFQKIFNIFLLEFGIIFHSVFVGLSLAVAGEQFVTLFVAISFHQFFEGLGLGARFATAKWPPHMSRFPWYLSLAYSLTTPLGIAAGLGVRHLYLNNDNTSLLVVGIFDGFCSGLLIYSCLIEFMARDFLMDSDLRESSLGWLILAYVMFLLGTIFMALVGKWA